MTAIQSTIEPSIRLDPNEVKLLRKNVTNLKNLVKYNTTVVVREILIDLMVQVQPRVPKHRVFDGEEERFGPMPPPGQLRESGRAVLLYEAGSRKFYQDVGIGKADGTIDVKQTISKSYFKATYIGGTLYYQRTNDQGQDIALWAHEYLGYEHERHDKNRDPSKYYARTPLTGPKYLETPWMENRKKYISWLSYSMRTIPKKVGKISKITKVPGKYTVDRVELVAAQIRRLGR